MVDWNSEVRKQQLAKTAMKLKCVNTGYDFLRPSEPTMTFTGIFKDEQQNKWDVKVKIHPADVGKLGNLSGILPYMISSIPMNETDLGFPLSKLLNCAKSIRLFALFPIDKDMVEFDVTKDGDMRLRICEF